MVTLRCARGADAPRLAELAAQLGYRVNTAQVRRRLPGLREPRDAVLVAVERRLVIGWLHVTGRRSLESGPFAEIVAMVVDERWRSRGVGALLVSRAERWARAHRFRELRVRSNVIRHRTHAFYRRLGYQIAKSQRVFSKSLTIRSSVD